MDTLSTVRRVEAALDRALDPEPEYLNALVGKALLLIELPWMLCGDEDRGEKLLRHAVALDTTFAPAREHLARHLEADGCLDEMPGAVLALRAASLREAWVLVLLLLTVVTIVALVAPPLVRLHREAEACESRGGLWNDTLYLCEPRHERDGSSP